MVWWMRRHRAEGTVLRAGDSGCRVTVVVAMGPRPRSKAGCWGGRLLWKLAFDSDQTVVFGRPFVKFESIRRVIMPWNYNTPCDDRILRHGWLGKAYIGQ